MSEIRVTALLRVAVGMLEEFKEFCSTVVEKVREGEAGSTITYKFYLDESDPAICLAQEVFADAEAFSKHGDNMSAMGQTPGHLFRVERLDICGQLPLEQARAMREYAEAADIKYTNFNYTCATI
jgi:quinol monooxygenase YgiN